MIGTIVAVVLLVIIVLYVIITYNSLISSKNVVKEAFSTMDVYLKKRWDLIPNLVETVKGYAKHESQTLENVVSLRNNYDSMTPEEKQQTEDLVNEWIQAGLDVTVEEMKKEDAVKSGAECMFIEKYPDVVTVYTIGDVSKELCGGPHVKNTSELGKFKIKKEEASSAGVRRIKAILEK